MRLALSLLWPGVIAIAAGGCGSQRVSDSNVPIYQRSNSSTPAAPRATTGQSQQTPEPARPMARRAAKAKAPRWTGVEHRLAHWTFNRQDLEEPEAGALTRAAGASAVPSFDGRALMVVSSNAPPAALYAPADARGRSLIHSNEGAIRFWFKPFWFSGGLPNRTPTWACLLDWAGFRLSADPIRGKLIFQTRSKSGAIVTNWLGPVFFAMRVMPVDPSFYWHEIILNYTRDRSWVIFDGAWIKSEIGAGGYGLGVGGARFDLAAPISLGAEANGNFPMEGMLDELETYDQPISPLESQRFLAADFLRATAREDPPGLELQWRNVADATNGCVGIQRRIPGGLWQPLTNCCRTSSFVDATAAIGQRYEYRVGERLVTAGVRAQPIENRGRVLVLVDETLAPALKTELEALRRDLAGDGWQPIFGTAPREDDGTWSNNPNGIARVKATIRREHDAPGGLRSVFLIGHVVVPYSGVGAEDGHVLPTSDSANHCGAWPADGYYGDLRGTWTDQSVDWPDRFFPRLQNIPGDGKFDQRDFTTNSLDVAVGRVDFANLSGTFPSLSELDLLRRYLQKDHRYRLGQWRPPARVAAAAFFPSPFAATGLPAYRNALRIASRGSGWIEHADLFQTPDGGQWGIESNYGAYNGIHGIYATIFADRNAAPQFAFYILAGSYFGDWDHPEDLLRAALGEAEGGLAAMYGHMIDWHFEAMGLGGALGDGLIDTSRLSSTSRSVRTLFLLGDPTLRADITPPPQLSLERMGGGAQLTWSLPPDGGADGCALYRSTNGWDGPFVRLPTDPNARSFLDAPAPPGAVYMARAAALIAAGSGSYTNLSQGAFAEF